MTRRRDHLLLLALLLLVAAQALWGVARDASVADEHPHLLSGWLYWQCGRFSGGLDNPPLGQLMLAAPLRLAQADYRFPSDTWLYLARLPVVLLLLGLLGLLWRWGESLGGTAVACAAGIALCLEPNLLAHGHLATLDFPLTFFWWAALWLWRRVLREAPEGRQVGWHGVPAFAVAVSLAMATKFTGVVLLPACALVAIVVRPGRRAWLELGTVLFGTLLLFLFLSHVFYSFEPTRYGLPQHLVQAVQGKMAHREAGHFAYLAGRRSLAGFPEYEIVALLLKTPLPLLLFALVGSVLTWKRMERLDRALLLLPAGVLLLVTSLAGVHIGVRHVLPVYPGLVLLAALGMAGLWRRGRWMRLGAVALTLWWGIGIARIAPQYLAYFNGVAGGPAGGHRFLLDSNLAWGQDDTRLRRFLQEASTSGDVWLVNPPGLLARTGHFAVDANTLHQLLRADERPYAWLRSFRPQGFAGYSWRLYSLGLEDFAQRAAAEPENLQAQLAYAEVLSRAGKAQEARALLEREAIGAAQLPVACRATWLYLEEGDLAAAGAWIERGLSVASSDPVLRRLQQRWQWQMRESTSAGSDAALGLGLWWLQGGEKERALDWIEKARVRGISEPEDVHALGSALLQVGEFSQAAHLLARAPGTAAPELAVARSLAQAEARFDQAEQQGTDLSTGDAASWMEFATALFRTRRYDDAAGVAMQVLRHEPDHSAALALLSEISVRSKLRLTEERLTPRAAPGVPRSETP